MDKWCIAVFCRNEAQTIETCLTKVREACGERNFEVFVFINGSSDATTRIVQKMLTENGDWLRAYEIPFPDKSNAWNQYIHAIRPNGGIYFFVDAYATVSTESFERLFRALNKNPSANAATGVPTSGRTVRHLIDTMKREGGLHGSLHALSAGFVERIRAREIRLPVRLYRNDGLIGAMAMHDLAPMEVPWSPSKILVVEEATWDHRRLSPWRWDDVRRQLNRMVQQARGRYENQAIKEIVYSKGFEGIPDVADQMILDHISRSASVSPGLFFKDPFAFVALRRVCNAIPPTLDQLTPRRLYPL